MHTTRLRATVALVFVIACLAASIPAMAQQGGTSRYVYDDNGRLRAVISPTGEAAVYNYDPAGNPTGIQRTPANQLTLIAFSPKSGAPGDRMEVIGTGFGTTAGASTVAFNGVSASVVQADQNSLVVMVPPGAATGLITVTNAGGTATSAVPFTVVQRIRVTPDMALGLPGDFIQFTASPSGTGIVWSVNGVVGGDSASGTITATGLYEAPRLPRSPIIIRAASADQPSVYGEALLFISNYPRIPAAAVSVQRGEPSPSAFAARQVSVQFGPAPGVILANGVAVEFGPKPGLFQAGRVSTVTGTYLSAITPVTLVRGTTTTITITGQGMAGATQVRFLLPAGQPDSSITVGNLQVSSDGTQLTADVTVGATAALDNRIVTVTAPGGSSPATDLGANLIRITQ
jgi:YD repeat-containing protein